MLLTCWMRWPAASRVSTTTEATSPARSAGACPSHARLQPAPPATVSGTGSGCTASPCTSTFRLPASRLIFNYWYFSSKRFGLPATERGWNT